MSLDPRIDDYDWEHIFEHYTGRPSNPRTREVLADVSYSREDVRRVIALANGENDGPDWLGAFEMNDGRFVFIAAGCDYTGWGCQESGSCEWSQTETDLIATCMTGDQRRRLGFSIADESGGAA